MLNLTSVGRSLLIVSLMLSCLAPGAIAQSGLGAVNGTVVDATAAPVADAAVSLLNVATGVVVKTTTDSAGIYNIFSLVTGQYKVTTEKAGFDKTIVDNVSIRASQTSTVDIQLKIGKVSDSVTVLATAPLLTPNTPIQATTMDRDLVEDLPYPERSALGAALLVAGVIGNVFDPNGVDSENPGIYTGYIIPGAGIGIGGAPRDVA